MRPSVLQMAFAMSLLLLASGLHAEGLQQPPNILLLVAEDLSARIGSYGDAVAQTPNIDRLASSGTRYTQVFTTAGVCAPSRAALIMGQHQISFGAQHMRTSTGPLGAYLAQPKAGHRAFPEILRRAGYFTFTDRKLDYQFSGISAGTGPFTLWDMDGVSSDAAPWSQRDENQPFFGLINFMETHESGVMRMDTSPYSDSHKSSQQMRRASGLVAKSVTNPKDVLLPPYYADLPAVRTDIARHYDNVHQMDMRVGQILALLAADGLAEDTIVLWTTDHGDGLPRGKRELQDSGIKVPLILHLPKKYRTQRMQAIDSRLVSFVDLAPTILTFAGVAIPEYMQGQNFLLAQRRYIYASRDRIDEVRDRQRAIRTKEYKYIRSWHPQVAGGHPLAYRDNLEMVRAMRTEFRAGRLTSAQARWFQPAGVEQLYDLSKDPHELTNLADAPAHASKKSILANQLIDWLVAVGDTSVVDESTMRASYLTQGQLPITPTPQASVRQGLLTASANGDYSVGYKIGGDRWRLYVEPTEVDDQPVRVKAVRYGWQESQIVSLGD